MWAALEYASPELRGDKEVVLAAVARNAGDTPGMPAVMRFQSRPGFHALLRWCKMRMHCGAPAMRLRADQDAGA